MSMEDAKRSALNARLKAFRKACERTHGELAKRTECPEAIRGAILLAGFNDALFYDELNNGLKSLLERIGALAGTIWADDQADPELQSTAFEIFRLAYPDADFSEIMTIN